MKIAIFVWQVLWTIPMFIALAIVGGCFWVATLGGQEEFQL